MLPIGPPPPTGGNSLPTPQESLAESLEPQDIFFAEQLEFLDRAGYLYQRQGMLGHQQATPEQALQQLKGGFCIYWNGIANAPKRPIQQLQQLSDLVDKVRQETER